LTDYHKCQKDLQSFQKIVAEFFCLFEEEIDNLKNIASKYGISLEKKG